LVPAEIYLTVAVRVCELNAKNRAAEAIGVAEVVSVRLSVNTACPTVFAASAPFVKAAFVTTTVHLVAFERSRYHLRNARSIASTNIAIQVWVRGLACANSRKLSS